MGSFKNFLEKAKTCFPKFHLHETVVHVGRRIQDAEKLRRTQPELEDSKIELNAERRELRVARDDLDRAQIRARKYLNSMRDAQSETRKIESEKRAVETLLAQAEQEQEETANHVRQWQTIVYCGEPSVTPTTFDLSSVSALLNCGFMTMQDEERPRCGWAKSSTE